MSSLNKWDVKLLNRHLPRYKKLEASEVKPSSANERHFIDVFVNGHPPITQHEIAYSRYKAEQPITETLKASTVSDNKDDDYHDGQIETTIHSLDEVLIGSEQSTKMFSLASKIRTHYQSKLPS